MCSRDYFTLQDTLKPILFVQYGNSCIDLYLCGLNIKHNCVLKNIHSPDVFFTLQEQIYCWGWGARGSSFEAASVLKKKKKSLNVKWYQKVYFSFSKACFKNVNLYIQAVPDELPQKGFSVSPMLCPNSGAAFIG